MLRVTSATVNLPFGERDANQQGDQTRTPAPRLLCHGLHFTPSFLPATPKTQSHSRRKPVELTVDVISILSPNELRVLRKQMAGMTLKTLSELSKISITQLSQYENGTNGLRLDQIQVCEKLLLAAVRSRSQVISKLLAPETCEETTAAG
jgi:hypothetical protein